MRSLAALVVLSVVASTGCDASTCGEGFEAREGRCVGVSASSCPEPCDAEAHEVCDTSLVVPACACAAGYEGDPCGWSGVLLDPGFEDASAWELKNGATVLPDAEGPTGKGVAFLAPSVVCNGGAIAQRVDMPPYPAAEPLVGELTYRARDANGIAVGIGRAWKHLPPSQGDDWSTRRFCLGEGAYGGSFLLQIASAEKLQACNTPPVEDGRIDVDRLTVELADAGECPLPGEVFNGDAEAGASGWSFDASGGAAAGFIAGGGRRSTDGVGLSSPETVLVGLAAMTTKLSVPLPTPTSSPSLRFWWTATEGHFFPVEVGTFLGVENLDRTLETLLGAGTWREHVYCLPPWTHGTIADLSFFLQARSEESEIVVDEVSVALDESCTGSADIHDPGFESVARRRPGIIVFGSTDQSFDVVRDPSRARTGEGFFEVEYATTSALVIVELWVFVPASDEGGGPQIRFYSSLPADPELRVRWVLGRASEREAELIPGGGWLLNQACLPPQWANRWYRFQVWIGDAGETFPIDPPKSILLDDFEVATSPACPSE